MPEVPDPNRKEGFMERMLQRRPSQVEADPKQPSPGLERQTSQEEHQESRENQENQTPLRRTRRHSRLQKLKEYMHSEEELDEAGKTYAKLM